MVAETRSFDRLFGELLHLHQPVDRIGLLFEDFALEVWSNSTDLLHGLAEYYRGFINNAPPREGRIDAIYALEAAEPDFGFELMPLPPEPGKNNIKEEYIDLPGGRLVRKRLTGMQFLFNQDTGIAVGACLTHRNQVVNFINSRFLQHELNQGALLLHAAGVSNQKAGLAIAGFSNRGKSSLALHLVDRGLVFVSNDRLALRRDHGGLRMTGIAQHPRVNPGTIMRLPKLHRLIPEIERQALARLSKAELWRLERKCNVDIFDFYGQARFDLHATLRGLVLLNWRLDGGSLIVKRVELGARCDLMSTIIKDSGLFYYRSAGEIAREPAADEYLDLLDGIPVYELTGGVDFNAATEFCLNLTGYTDG
jgi:HprK-related kinase B